MKLLFATSVVVAGMLIAGGSLFTGSDAYTATATGNSKAQTADAVMASSPVEARTVTLTVEGMSCVTCPLMVRRVLERVEGVAKAEVSYRDKTAVVRYDPAKCDVNALIAATNSIGFPSRVIEP